MRSPRSKERCSFAAKKTMKNFFDQGLQKMKTHKYEYFFEILLFLKEQNRSQKNGEKNRP